MYFRIGSALDTLIAMSRERPPAGGREMWQKGCGERDLTRLGWRGCGKHEKGCGLKSLEGDRDASPPSVGNQIQPTTCKSLEADSSPEAQLSQAVPGLLA